MMETTLQNIFILEVLSESLVCKIIFGVFVI